MKKNIFFTLSSILFISLHCYSQNYIGTGNNTGVVISSSSEANNSLWQGPASAENLFSGDGMRVDYFEASRFLSQASMGFEESDILSVESMGIEAWIDDQIAKPIEYISPEVDNIYQILRDTLIANGEDISYLFRPGWTVFNYAWWEVNMRNQDLLRHRVAAALSEILVISKNSELHNYGDGLGAYYDILLEHAFGNYSDLLNKVTISPMMGDYLSHLNNPKSLPSENITPDENFAREVMQLFSIGLYELNPDGSRKLQGGNFIPTYDQSDIKEFAKVFTGLGVAENIPNPWTQDPPYFGQDLVVANTTMDMIMYENWHEPGIKYLLNNVQTPSGLTGSQEIEFAVNHLCAHSNVGPFIGYRLIQRLVKSNPTAAYISRISSVWNDNGSGIRGDLGAVVKAILMDPEARNCSWQSKWRNSKMKEPMMRYLQFARAVEKENGNNFYWNVNYQFRENALQEILYAPTVFNFFTPDYAPVGGISEANLVAPEFKIHDSRSSIGYMNQVNLWVQDWGYIMNNWENMTNVLVKFVTDDWQIIAQDSEALINKIDEVFLGGKLSDQTREIIREALNTYDIEATGYNAAEERVEMGIYLALISPDFVIQN